MTRPDQPRVEQWQTDRVFGFGLLQRDREFEHYGDQEALYHNRPSVWVETKGTAPWSSGSVELLELPAKDETEDNIGAYFVVDQSRLPNERPIKFAYTVTFGFSPPPNHDVAQVVDASFDAKANVWTVSFQLPAGMTPEGLEPHAQGGQGKCTNVRLEVGEEGIVKVKFSYEPFQQSEDRLQVWLSPKGSKEKSSEVWSYRWSPLSRQAS